jgi:hypothetical protein
MNRIKENIRNQQIRVWIQESILLVACFLYVYFYLHPLLIMEAQTPVFLMTADFLNEFLKIPGGLTDWLSALIMQCWFSDLIISLTLTVSYGLVMVLTNVWMGTLFAKRPLHSFFIIPAGLLIVYQSQFDFHYSVTVALIINLLAVVLFLRWAPPNQYLRTPLGLAGSLLLYWITGGAFFLFVVLVGLDELMKKRFISGAFMLIISGILPYIASLSLVLVPLKQAYVHNLSLEQPLEVWYTGYFLPAFFVFTFFIALLAPSLRSWKLFKKIADLDVVWKLTAGVILLAGGTVFLSQESINEVKRHVLMVNRAVADERWSDVLSLTKNCKNETPLILSQSNLALYQTGKLLDSMFAYPQSKGSLGLLMNQTWSLAWSEDASRVSWKLGLVNESQHWAHEAFEHKGASPDLLKRLGKIYMVKGNPEAARRYFLNLKHVPFQGSMADYYLHLNEIPGGCTQDDECRTIQSMMPTEDLISRWKSGSPKLSLLLKRNPSNKMAFEYMIADLLLTGNLREIFDHLGDFETFHYAQIPRHVQEAVIFAASVNPKISTDILQSYVTQNNFQRFLKYRKILVSHQGDRDGAIRDLSGQYDDTYWYYLMFVKPPTRQSESQNEFQ